MTLRGFYQYKHARIQILYHRVTTKVGHLHKEHTVPVTLQQRYLQNLLKQILFKHLTRCTYRSRSQSQSLPSKMKALSSFHVSKPVLTSFPEHSPHTLTNFQLSIHLFITSLLLSYYVLQNKITQNIQYSEQNFLESVLLLTCLLYQNHLSLGSR